MADGVLWDSPYNIHAPAERMMNRALRGGGGGGGGMSADQTFAALTRQMWPDFMRIYAP